MKIEVLNAIIDGKGKGEVLDVDKKQAEHLINIGYAKEVVEAKEPEPTKQTAKRTTKKAQPKADAE